MIEMQNTQEQTEERTQEQTQNHARRLESPRILIVGCGDVGLRCARLLVPRFRVFALVRNTAQHAALRAAGVVPVPGDLDDPASLVRLAGLAPLVLHLAPPPDRGMRDTRMRNLLPRLAGVKRLVYVSTSGVYGDCQGEHIDETRAVAPRNARAYRRVDAERRLRRWARTSGAHVAIVRAPGIYGADRLPLARLAAGTPVLAAADDVYTNHIHADDLARIVIAALFHGAPQRVYHASDDSELKMADWFDQVARAFDLPTPPRLPRVELEARLGATHAQLLSFMQESRRLDNRRIHGELGVRLTYPTTASGVKAAQRTIKSTLRQTETR